MYSNYISYHTNSINTNIRTDECLSLRIDYILNCIEHSLNDVDYHMCTC